MSLRIARLALVCFGVAACSDNGPQVPILFVAPVTGANGAGRVTSSPAGIDCNVSNQTSTGTCSANFPEGTAVTLSANSASGSGFATWGGACSGAVNTCLVTLDQSADVTAQFSLANPRTLSVAPTGSSGSGTITSNPGGLNCAFNGSTVSGTCTADFADGAVVTLTATPVAGSGFVTWGGDCATSAGGASCPLVMSAARNVSGNFVSVAFSGLVVVAGSSASGLVVVSIPVASARLGGMDRPRVSASTAALGSVLAVGTLRYLGETPTQVAGFYDPDTKVLSLESGTPGTGFSSQVTLTSSTFDGAFSDGSNGRSGLISLFATSGATPPITFCGSFLSTDPTAGSDAGTWNVVVNGSAITGFKNSANAFNTLSGTVSGRSITLDILTGVPPDLTSVGQASATLSSDNASLAGTYTDGSTSGTWTASTTCQ